MSFWFSKAKVNDPTQENIPDYDINFEAWIARREAGFCRSASVVSACGTVASAVAIIRQASMRPAIMGAFCIACASFVGKFESERVDWQRRASKLEEMSVDLRGKE